MKSLEGPLLPILHEIQDEFGYVPQETLPLIARELNLSRAEVHGVVTFYHDYRDHPGRPACPEALSRRGLPVDGRRRSWPNGSSRCSASISTRRRSMAAVTLEPVYCLGLCSAAPAAMLDGEVHGRLDDDAVDDLVAEVRHDREDFRSPRCRSSCARRRASRQGARTARSQPAASMRTIVRNGSRGLHWLEPMVEVEDGGKAGSPMARSRLTMSPRCSMPGWSTGGDHPLCLGKTEELPIPEEPDAADLRPLRHHRSAVARRLRGP